MFILCAAAVLACMLGGCQDLVGTPVPVLRAADAGTLPDAASLADAVGGGALDGREAPDAGRGAADAAPAATCTDAVQNGGETDIDCGGNCPGCALGQGCASTSDCAGGVVCDGVCRLAASCSELLAGAPLADGTYTIDPDGADDRYGAVTVVCDMTTDGGGWTLIGDYRSNLELFAYSPLAHQVQNASGGAAMADPPVLDGSVHGHLAYDMLVANQVRLQCRPEGASDWFGAQSNLFTDWSAGDKGMYGSAQWGIVGHSGFGRSNHFICGYQVNTNDFFGVGICSGPGQGGSFANHVVSLSFNRAADQYSGGLSIGCNGTGLNLGKSADWGARVWLR